MYQPIKNTIPCPPSGKTGWPWILKDREHLCEKKILVDEWPKISIVTPSYNQGKFLEETIRSVVLQGYPNLEYIIIDGGSNDNTLQVIRKYEPWVSYWISEPDRGQAHAINKGWVYATGSILAWLNSDDLYKPSALYQVADVFQKDSNTAAAVGSCQMTDSSGNIINYKLVDFDSENYDLNPLRILSGGDVPGQPSIFISSEVFKTIGKLNEKLYYTLDWEYWIRLAMHFPQEKIILIESILSESRQHNNTKTSLGSGSGEKERRMVIDQIYKMPNLSPQFLKIEKMAYANAYWRQGFVELRCKKQIQGILNLFRANSMNSAEYNIRRISWLLMTKFFRNIIKVSTNFFKKFLILNRFFRNAE